MSIEFRALGNPEQLLQLESMVESCQGHALRSGVWALGTTSANKKISHDALEAFQTTYGPLDYCHVPSYQRLSDFRLIAMDMDSTLITIECIDEIADFCAKKAQVAQITEATMRGEITSFEESLRRRVAILAGLDQTALERVYQERLRLSPGAQNMLLLAQAQGIQTLLVSGGFTYFANQLKERLQLTQAHANVLEIEKGKLTGKVLGRIVDAQAKADFLDSMCRELGISNTKSIAMGDGSNDLKMMSLAGLSVAFRAKPIVRQTASMVINRGGLDSLISLLAL